jgi:hypothetical protein
MSVWLQTYAFKVSYGVCLCVQGWDTHAGHKEAGSKAASCGQNQHAGVQQKLRPEALPPGSISDALGASSKVGCAQAGSQIKCMPHGNLQWQQGWPLLDSVVSSHQHHQHHLYHANHIHSLPHTLQCG